jgi:N-acetylmuramoyl-L-alanine amidase CwlA
LVIIRKQLVSEEIAKKVSYGKVNRKNYIIIHETGNFVKKANADSHADLQSNGNPRKASWHYQVDEIEAVQSFEHEYGCWASGSYAGNKRGIQIEMCVNEDGNYEKTVQNTVELVQKIMKEEKISIDFVKQHNFFSGKNCPMVMRSGKMVSWGDFIAKVKNVSPEQKQPLKDAESGQKTVSGHIGVLTIKSDSLNFRESKSLNSKIIKVLKKGESYKVYSIDKNWFSLGKGFVSNPNEKYALYQENEKTEYQVIKGDTLTSISKKFKTTISNLKKINNLK